MLPIIKQILTGVVEGIGEAISETLENNAKPKLKAPAVTSKPNTEIPPMLKAMAPQSFETFQEPAKQQQKNFRSTSTLTMDRIVDTHTGSSNKTPVAANDPDIMFAGRPQTNAPDPTAKYILPSKSNDNFKEAANSNDVMFEGRYKTRGTGANKDGRNSHILKMFSGNNDKFRQHDNDNNPDAVVVSLEPLLKNIDLNTTKMSEQLKEISSSIDKLFDAENGPFSKFNQKEKELESRERPSVDRSTNRDSNRSSDKKDSLLDTLTGAKNKLVGAALGLAGGGLINGLGSYIAGPDSRVNSQGGYGAGQVNVNPNKNSSRSQTQMQLYSAFKKQGLSDEGARTMVAQVGRENNFNPKTLYGHHRDPHNGSVNAGMMSWQKDRGNEFIKFMTEKGLFRNGKLAQGQESLNAQAEFAVREMQRRKEWQGVLRNLKDPSKSYKELEADVGRKYVGWRYDDPKYHASGMRNQNIAYSEIKKLSDGQSKGNPGSGNNSIASSRKPSESPQMAKLGNNSNGTRALAGAKPMNYAPSQISGPRNGMGSNFNKASAQQSVINNTTNLHVNQTTNQNSQQPKQTASKEKRQIPPTRPMGYQDVWNKYFG